MNGAAIQTISTRNMYIHVLMVISLLRLGECHNSLFGTAELRGMLPRRSRLLSDFTSNIPNDHSRSGFIPAAIPLSSSKSTYSRSLLPTEESTTVTSVSPPVVSTSPEPINNEPTPTADTMRKYARILKIDTENMNEEQRELLLRIVQRIARLNGARPDEESIDLNVNEGRARRNKHRDDRKKKKPSTTAASDALKNNSTNAAASTSTTASTSSSSKKHRTTPASHSGSSSSTSSSSGTTTTTASKKKVAASNYIAISTATASPTTPTIATKVGKSKVTPSTDLTMSNATSMDLGNISTTSIVDVLSTDNARENFYIRRPSPSTITALHNKIQPQKVSVEQIGILK